MQTEQIIRASAQVITITEFAEGDVYKRVHTAYSGSTPELRFGIVTSVMHNGTDGAIVATEYAASFREVVTEQKVWSAGAEAALFVATPEEVTAHLDTLREAAYAKVKEADKALLKAREAAAFVDDMVARADAGRLTRPASGTPAELAARAAQREQDEKDATDAAAAEHAEIVAAAKSLDVEAGDPGDQPLDTPSAD